MTSASGKKSILIAPSILSADFSKLDREILEVEEAGADWIHVDVMDGHFVPNLTVGPVVVRWIRGVTDLPLDVHLMIESPESYIPQFAESGADSVTFHWEACPDPAPAIGLLRKLKKRAGMSLRPKTPVEKILPYVKDLDLVLVMTVEPGFGGQKFMSDMMPKVRALKEHIARHRLDCRIEVDGGINPETAAVTVREGADTLVAGNSIFAQKDRRAALRQIRDSALKISHS